jgi:hypothetical protein
VAVEEAGHGLAGAVDCSPGTLAGLVCKGAWLPSPQVAGVWWHWRPYRLWAWQGSPFELGIF